MQWDFPLLFFHYYFLLEPCSGFKHILYQPPLSQPLFSCSVWIYIIQTYTTNKMPTGRKAFDSNVSSELNFLGHKPSLIYHLTSNYCLFKQYVSSTLPILSGEINTLSPETQLF